ncbi:MAG TPA: ABC transporter permease [Clostridium sp.]|uniref:ABC transporter permease n=1 Tax=Clostridium sp. TaxID=1506 RepID=UPI002F953B7D
MRISQLFKIALYSVWTNKIRSFLTMLGIIIGISSVIILVGIGKGTEKEISDQISSLGTNLITVSLSKTASIDDVDLKELESKPGIKAISPQISSSNVNVKAGSKSSTTSIEASNESYAEVKSYTVSSGRFITDRDVKNRYNVLVIGTETANNIFGTTNVVGETMYVSGIQFKIIGVLTSAGTSTTGSGDDKIILPITTAQRLLKTSTISTYYIESKSQAEVDTAMSYLKMFLNKKYGLNNLAISTTTDTYYRVLSQTSLLTTATSTTKSMSNMLSGVATISLLVGGIGIMNIMLVSVIERTKEIGTRKAIGAKRRTILTQFLIEAAIVSGLGGLLGVLFGYAGAYIGKTFFATSIIIANNVVISAFAFSVVIGLAFGIYPADKASKLNPIEALRYE